VASENLAFFAEKISVSALIASGQVAQIPDCLNRAE
jgi:hypothetical protein